ncbi:MAG: P1 family peptidase [Firmicutes bacterium]|nr:P1 family peptidase [Bacillota bacterium]
MNNNPNNSSANILLPEGILIGHEHNDKTGVTVILAPRGAVGGVCVRGSAPGTRETDLLAAEKAVPFVNAVVLSGGSAFGLSACSGVMRYCRENDIGFKVGAVKIPLVSGAVIFDMHDSSYAHPSEQDGYSACVAAKSSGLAWGLVGAGKGATVGKVLGAAAAQKGGIGAATVSIGNIFVTAVTVVNALGDVLDYTTGKILRGAAIQDKHVNTHSLILSGSLAGLMQGGNTTLTCILTNAKLSKLQANKLASLAHDGFAKCISPVHTDYDGDTAFVLSSGETVFDFTALGVLCVEAVCQSVRNAVQQ